MNNMEKDIQKDSHWDKVMITDGVKHTVPLNEILSIGEIVNFGHPVEGKPPKDKRKLFSVEDSAFLGKEGPAIDNPKFISIDEADDFLEDGELGISLCMPTKNGKGEDCRFYPFQIMFWHEIINDVVGGVPMLVTYCSLCYMGRAFERIVNGKVMKFGASGFIWRSGLVISDKPEDVENGSFWSEGLGQAIKGDLAGTKLKSVQTNSVKYGDWKKKYPKGQVLSKDTGNPRRYGYNALGDYYTSKLVAFGASFDDKRLHPKEFVLGIRVVDKYKAYASADLQVGETKDEFNGKTIIINKSETGEIKISSEDGEPISKIQCFWFSWLNGHPDTELFSPNNKQEGMRL